jgi:N-acetylmuramoyl-L-alanine amidase
MTANVSTIRNLPGRLILTGLLLLPTLSAQSRSSITDIRIQHQPGLTKVTVAVTGNIDIKADRLENPPRFFLDFADTIPALASRPERTPRGAIQAIPATGDLLKQVRVAENQVGLTRLVFDLLSPDIEYRTIVQRDPLRLVVEIRPEKQSTQPKNPLAAPPAPAEPRKFTLDTSSKRPAVKIPFRLLDPPVLASTFRLPKADPSQMPYKVSGFVFRDFRFSNPPTAVSRQASQALTPGIAASRTSAGRQSLTRVLGLKIGKVVIDPGHGGHDAGSTGISGLPEKELTLDIAKRLKTLLETNLGSEVILTRDEDVYLSPEQRTQIANQHHADLFISIHANSSPLKTATGVETYYLNFTSSPEALEVAARENASSEKSVGDLGDLIKKIALKDKIDESREFASKIQQSLFSGSTKAGNRTKDRGVRKAPFIVLIGAGMPSVLTEIGFLSNAREEALLKKPEYRQKIAEALSRGISQYTDTLSHFNVAQSGAGND